MIFKRVIFFIAFTVDIKAQKDRHLQSRMIKAKKFHVLVDITNV